MNYWYRTAPAAAGSTGGIVGNNPQFQVETSPNEIVEDKIFLSALLMSNATVSVQVGDNPAVSYQGVEGINHWNQPFDGQTGAVTFSVSRNGALVNSSTGPEITASTNLTTGVTNYNCWVGSF